MRNLKDIKMTISEFIALNDAEFVEFRTRVGRDYGDDMMTAYTDAREYLQRINYNFNHAFMDWLIPFIIYHYYYFDVEVIGIPESILLSSNNERFFFLKITPVAHTAIYYIIDSEHYTLYINEQENINIATEDTLKALDANMMNAANTLGVNKSIIVTKFVNSIKPADRAVLKEEFDKNSDSILTSDVASRFSSANWFEKIQEVPVMLAGVGGIGSWCALLLSRVYPETITLFDDDRVEMANMSGQFYSSLDVGREKVQALYNAMKLYSNYNSVFCINNKFEANTVGSDVMICGFDSIDARRIYFNAWVKHLSSVPEEHRKNCLFIDGRLAAEDFQIYCLTGDSPVAIAKYETTLFGSSEAEQTVCSYKQTSFMANLIAGFMVNLFVNFVANMVNEDSRELPYLTIYNGETMYFKIANP